MLASRSASNSIPLPWRGGPTRIPYQNAKREVCHAHVRNMALMCVHVGLDVRVSLKPVAPEALFDAHIEGAMTPAVPATMARWRRHEFTRSRLSVSPI